MRTNAGESSLSRGEILQDEDGSTSHFVEEEHQRLQRNTYPRREYLFIDEYDEIMKTVA